MDEKPHDKRTNKQTKQNRIIRFEVKMRTLEHVRHFLRLLSISVSGTFDYYAGGRNE